MLMILPHVEINFELGIFIKYVYVMQLKMELKNYNTYLVI